MAKKIEDVISGIEDKLDIIFEEINSKYHISEEQGGEEEESDEEESDTEVDESRGEFTTDKKPKVEVGGFSKDGKGDKDDAGFDGDEGPESDDAEPVKESVGNFVDAKDPLVKTSVKKGGTPSGKVANIQTGGWKKGTPVAGKNGKVTGNATKDNKNLADKGSCPDAEQKGSSEGAGFDGKSKSGKNLTTGAINKGNKGFGSSK